MLRETDPDHALLDDTLAECDRVGDGRADYSSKHKRHGVNVQVVTDPAGTILWLSPALPGRTHNLTTALAEDGTQYVLMLARSRRLLAVRPAQSRAGPLHRRYERRCRVRR